MNIQARSPSCFSDKYVLKLNGRPIGEYCGRWFSESIDIHLVGRRKLHLDKTGWLGNEFVLFDAVSKHLLGQAERGGAFSTSWNLKLSIGQVQMFSEGIFNTSYAIVQGNVFKAKVDRIGLCEGGWHAKSMGKLKDTDLIFIGLVYHTILRRQSSAATTAAS